MDQELKIIKLIAFFLAWVVLSFAVAEFFVYFKPEAHKEQAKPVQTNRPAITCYQGVNYFTNTMTVQVNQVGKPVTCKWEE